MTIARSTLNGDKFGVQFPEEQGDPYLDEEPTVKIKVPQFCPQVVVQEKRYPGVGIIIALTFGILSWGSLIYILWSIHS